MDKLTKKQKDFIDNNFYEDISDQKLQKNKFDLLSSTYELQYIVENHNWDNNLKLLNWVVTNKLCSESTALEVFWLSQPQDFLKYELTKKLKNTYENEIFDLIKTILKNFNNHFYLKTDISFDITSYLNESLNVPDFMKVKTDGEIPYLYYNETDFKSWFGEYLINKISNCDTSMELYSIAYFVEKPNIAKLILNQSFCDKGIALMIFWRLKTYASLWSETEDVLQIIIEKIKNNKLRENISYNPYKDLNIEIKELKNKWGIPNIMKQKINCT